MIKFDTIILKFDKKGEKTGWSYIDVPFDIADQLKPNCKKAFRVKGYLDNYKIEQVSLLPMGEGNFIMALNSDMRKGIRKGEGAMLQVQLEVDESEFEFPQDIMECLEEDEEALSYFKKLAGSHQRYFIKWIESAKTEPTRIKRIAQMISALSRNMGYPEMIRESKARRQDFS